jgi:hypothetical protein
MRLKKSPITAAALLGAALLLGGCAKITAPNVDFAGPTASLDIKATAVNALFSHFKGDLTVTSVLLQHAGPTAPVTSSVTAGTSGGITTVRISATPTFSVGDTVTVTWSGNAVTLVGSPHVITQSARYRILTARLAVQTPWGGLGPGKSGKVCVALLPNAPSDVNVTLSSSWVQVAPTTLHIAAGQSRASAAATATAAVFACPLPSTAGATAGSSQPRCSGSNGVAAAGTLNGVAIYGCGTVGESCCGISGQNCASDAPPPASLCP